MNITGPLPPNIVKCLPPEERPAGPAGWTEEEAQEAYEHGQELALHDEIIKYLRLKKIAFVRANPAKRSRIKVGWPDFTCAVRGRAVAFEAKGPNGELSDEQEDVRREMTAPESGWVYVVVTQLGQVKSVIDDLEMRLGC